MTRNINHIQKLTMLLSAALLSACTVDESQPGKNESQSPVTQTCEQLKTTVKVTAGQRALCQPWGLVIHSDLRRTPSLAVEQLSPEDFSGAVSRTDDFRPDDRLPRAVRAELSDYRGSGLDRGHLAPAADMSSSKDAMSASFLLSNIAPQNPDLNREAWAGLESATRECARTAESIFVLTGVSGESGRIGQNVVVPAHFYKIWINGKQARAWVMPNRDVGRLSGQQIARYEVNPETLRSVTGTTLPLTRGRFCAGSLPVGKG